jgi:hypothetical protein
VRPKFLTPVHLRHRQHPKAHTKFEGLDAVAAVGYLMFLLGSLAATLGAGVYILYKLAT